MKKIIVLPIIFMILGYSQTSSNIRIGLIGGINVNSAQVEILNEGADVSSKTGFGIGGVFDWKLNQVLGLRFEPMYLQKGIGETEIDIQPGIKWYASTSYIEIPVLLKAKFVNNVNQYVFLGPSVGLLFDTEVTAKLNNITFKGDSKGATENFDTSIIFGGGLNIPMDHFTVFIEGRYMYGFSNTIKGGRFEISTKNVSEEIEWSKDTDKLLNRGFQILGGISFPF